jgi:hypothetical protein
MNETVAVIAGLEKSKMTIMLRALCLAILVFPLFQNTAESQTVFSISVNTDQSRYFLGQQVSATVEACNPTSATAIDFFPGPCDRDQFQIFDDSSSLVAFSDFSPWCPPYSIPVELDPGECQEIEVWEWRQIGGGSPHNAYGEQVAPGMYSVVANIFEITSEPAVFEILAARQATPVPMLRIWGLIVFGIAVGVGGIVLVRRHI